MVIEQNDEKDKILEVKGNKSSNMHFNVKYHSELKKNENYVLEALRLKPELFEHIDSSFRNDKNFVIKVVKENIWMR